MKAGEGELGLQRWTKQENVSGQIPRLKNREVQSIVAFWGLLTMKGPEGTSWAAENVLYFDLDNDCRRVCVCVFKIIPHRALA